MGEQCWQTVTNKKQIKVKPEEPTKFDPIIARQREATEKAQVEKIASQQIKYGESVNKEQDWKYVTINKPQPKPKSTLPQRATSSIKINEDGDIIKIKKVSPQMSKAIIDARIVKKWTQIQLANNAGVDTKTVNEIERGNCLYVADVFNKLTKALGINIQRDYLVEEKK